MVGRAASAREESQHRRLSREAEWVGKPCKQRQAGRRAGMPGDSHDQSKS